MEAYERGRIRVVRVKNTLRYQADRRTLQHSSPRVTVLRQQRRRLCRWPQIAVYWLNETTKQTYRQVPCCRKWKTILVCAKFARLSLHNLAASRLYMNSYTHHPKTWHPLVNQRLPLNLPHHLPRRLPHQTLNRDHNHPNQISLDL